MNSNWKRYREGLVRHQETEQNYMKELRDCALISQGKWSEKDKTTLFKYQISKKVEDIFRKLSLSHFFSYSV